MGSNSRERFQFCTYGTLPLPSALIANPGVPRLFRKTRPSAFVPSTVSIGAPEMNGGLPDNLTGCAGFAVPPAVEPLAKVDTAVKLPKSGFGKRLLPVSVACEIP